MTSNAENVAAYLDELPPGRRELVEALRATILDNLPEGFVEQMSYGMIGYVVPLSRYPAGYHCDPQLPLPFINLGNQKASVNLYHSALYAMPGLVDWFRSSWGEHTSSRLDMGKSCVRFKRATDTPLALVGQLAAKVTVEDWITFYESEIRR